MYMEYSIDIQVALAFFCPSVVGRFLVLVLLHPNLFSGYRGGSDYPSHLPVRPPAHLHTEM